MPSLDPGLLEWAVRAAAPGAEVAEVRGLRDGDIPAIVAVMAIAVPVAVSWPSTRALPAAGGEARLRRD